MKFLKKMFDDEDEHDVEGHDTIDEAFETKPKAQTAAAPRAAMMNGATVNLLNATDVSAMRDVIKSVRDNEMVIVTLTNLKTEEKSAAFHTLRGATQALDATLEPLNDNQVFMAPKGWIINGDMVQ